MLRHVVLLQFSDAADTETISTVFRGFHDLARRLPGIRGVSTGPNASPEGLSRGYEHGFVMDFDDAKARDAYLAHPDHVAFAGDVVLPALRAGIDSVAVFDYEMEG